ncbi:hypothetical protein B0H10DRAFT_1812256, partial [Mycena sp. CBHHK59/15]
DALARTRRRFSNAQIVLLEHLFHTNPHPSLEERELVARCADMEVKSVTIWFQNKRQTERKTACREKSSASIADSRTTRRHAKSTTTSRATSTTSTSASGRPSLDRVASRSELRAPAPRTPSRRHNPLIPLWENMASSPLVSQSSPCAREYVQFGQETCTRTLEWACARRRLVGKEEGGVPGLEADDSGGDTDVEVDEAVTPGSSYSAGNLCWTAGNGATLKAGEPDDETMTAALALCGLMHG